ncbi:Helix-turn-helix domain [Promicromonospora umidemergens]|uniref:Helix-turn-helix domain-containing protein n=1 Tax=Promicromonospora umidemergens TaxID=629679 RepID=A0ABP8XHY8_9MICO|nr:helix-turn-helix domain-containing protein [Promicromonospora umidemergens]MCP2284848.1 Helix-turn-helix domain [Promicromonospora umidemergens]
MTPRLTVPDAAAVGRRHPETLRKALQDGTLHGTQRIKRGPWLIRPECLAAWLEGEQCAHQVAEAAAGVVTDIATRRAVHASV